jgi:DNA-binding transcriptional LysR family regulator
LLNRTTRSVSLTEAGARYLERIAAPLRELHAAAEELGGDAERPVGLLRLNIARAAYMTVMKPVLSRFLAAYPEIDLELVIENSLVDIIARGFDAGIRYTDLVDEDMVAVPVGPALSAHVIASPEYLARNGAPDHPQQLLTHDCIAFPYEIAGQMAHWVFRKNLEQFEVPIRARLVVNDSTAMTQAVLDGVGIGYTSNGFIEGFLTEGRLVRLLADWSPPVPGFALFYPSRRRAPRKLRALIEFLRPGPHPSGEGAGRVVDLI